MAQTAASVSAGLGFGGTSASNVADATANVSSAINTNFQTNLNNVGLASQQVFSSACNTNVYGVDFNTQQSFTEAGQQTASEVATATQSLSQSISQSATAVNLGLLMILIGIAIVIIALGYFVAKSGSGAAKVIIPFVVVGGIGVGSYLGYRYLIKKSAAGPDPLIVTATGTTPPPIVLGAAYSVQFNASSTGTTVGPYTWTVLGTASNNLLRSLNLALNTSTGLLSTPAGITVPSSLSDGSNSLILTVYVTDSTTPHPNIGTNTYVIPIGNESLTISSNPSTLPPIVVGQVYSPVQFSASGGSGTYTWQVMDAADLTTLGLALGSTGQLVMQNQGVPICATPQSYPGAPPGLCPNGPPVGNATFTVYVTDSAGNTGTLPVSVAVQSS